MKILYMGTAAAEGWPALFCSCRVCADARRRGGRNLRTRTQALIDGDLLIDFPPETYAHMNTYGVELNRLHHLLVTHSHMDHWFAPDLIHRNEHFAHNAEGVLHIYGNSAVEESFYREMGIERFRNHPIDQVIQFHAVHSGDTFTCGSWTVTAVAADHDRLEECLIYICRKDGKTLLYGHDTGLSLRETSWALLEKEHYDLISLDTTMGRKSIGGYHMGTQDVEAFVDRLQKAGAIDGETLRVINHFSHNGDMTYDELTRWAEERGMLATYDGMTVDF